MSGVRGVLWEGTLNHPHSCFPGPMHEDRVLILPSWPHPKGIITSCHPKCPPIKLLLFLPCRDAGAVVPTRGCPATGAGSSTSLGSASRGCFQVGHWGGRAGGRRLPRVPVSALPQPSQGGCPSGTRPPRRDRPVAYPWAQGSFHGGRQTAWAGRGRQPPGLQGLKAAPWPGAGLPPQPKSHGKSWQAPLRAAGG